MRSEQSGSELGVTMVELTVVLFIMSIVGVIMFSFLGSVMKTTTRANKDVETEKAIELALRPMTEDIRGAGTIASVYPTTTACSSGGTYPAGYSKCLSFVVTRPAPGFSTCPKSIVTFGLRSDGIVREDRTDYSLSGNTCVASTVYNGRKLLTNVVNGTQPLFTYFDRFGNALNPTASGQTNLPFQSAAMVRVNVNVKYLTGAPLLSYTSDLTLRNNR